LTIESYEIVGSYNNQRVTSIDAERSVNLFEYVDPLGKKPKSLLPTSGLAQPVPTPIFTGAAIGYRGQFVAFNGAAQLMFVVIGQYIYRIDQGLNVTPLNSTPLTTSVGVVRIEANNGNALGQVQVIFVDGEQGFIYNLATSVFTQILDPRFPVKPIDVTYLDGFFVVANGDSNQFQLSSFNEGLIWSESTGAITAADNATNIFTTASTSYFPSGNPIVFTAGMGGTLPANVIANTTYYVINLSPTTFSISDKPGGAVFVIGAGFVAPVNVTNAGQLQLGTISSHPGNIVACRTLHRRLFLFSQNFTEVWENNGIGSNLPFRRNNGLLMEYGTPAIGSVAVGFDKMFFLSQDKDGQGSVMEVVGTESMPVSNRALDYAIAQYASDPMRGVADAKGFLIKENGLIFYRLNFTAANHTYVYGVTMSDPQNMRWHEEEVLNGNRHPAQTHGYFYGRNYVGSYNSTLLYLVDDSYSTNDGEAIRRMRIGRPIMPPTSQRLRVDRFQLDLLQGAASNTTFITEELDLLTETDNLTLLTESGINIITENPLIISTSNEPPTVFLSVSKDGGQTYDYRVQAPMGAIGQRTFRTVWRKLGATKRGQAFVPRIEFFNKTPFIILGATWVYEVLPQ
jgi:hypothetical protein